MRVRYLGGVSQEFHPTSVRSSDRMGLVVFSAGHPFDDSRFKGEANSFRREHKPEEYARLVREPGFL